jgi:hypothetical protein
MVFIGQWSRDRFTEESEGGNGEALSIAPILLGDGLRLFGTASTEQRWRLKDVVAYKTGFVELSYGREPDSS